MLGNNIRKIMANKKIAAKDLAATLGISPTHLSYIINNRRKPSFELLNQLADALTVSVSKLTSDIENTNNSTFSQVIGKIIKKRREEQNMTAEELALMAGIDLGFIRSLENSNEDSPDLNSILKIAAALNLDNEELLEEVNLEKEKRDSDIRELVKMGEKLTPEQRQRMMEVTKAMFPEIFKDEK